MKKEFEKLNLSANQYRRNGNLMMFSALVILIAIIFICDYSFALSVVFAIIGLELGAFGFIFRLIYNKISSSDDEEFLSHHTLTEDSERKSNITSALVIFVVVSLAVSAFLVVKNYDSQQEAEETTVAYEKTVTVEKTEEITEEITEIEDHSVVFATENGKCYHYSDKCSNGNYFAITIDEALKHGLAPCKKCVN